MDDLHAATQTTTQQTPVAHTLSVPFMCHPEAQIINETRPGTRTLRRSPWPGAEAREFEPRTGANPNRLSSPFAAAKVTVSPRCPPQSAQVSGVAPGKATEAAADRRNPPWPSSGPARARQHRHSNPRPDPVRPRRPGPAGHALEATRPSVHGHGRAERRDAGRTVSEAVLVALREGDTPPVPSQSRSRGEIWAEHFGQALQPYPWPTDARF